MNEYHQVPSVVMNFKTGQYLYNNYIIIILLFLNEKLTSNSGVYSFITASLFYVKDVLSDRNQS